jgi:hypothetical protein
MPTDAKKAFDGHLQLICIDLKRMGNEGFDKCDACSGIPPASAGESRQYVNVLYTPVGVIYARVQRNRCVVDFVRVYVTSGLQPVRQRRRSKQSRAVCVRSRARVRMSVRASIFNYCLCGCSLHFRFFNAYFTRTHFRLSLYSRVIVIRNTYS